MRPSTAWGPSGVAMSGCSFGRSEVATPLHYLSERMVLRGSEHTQEGGGKLIYNSVAGMCSWPGTGTSARVASGVLRRHVALGSYPGGMSTSGRWVGG
jgi:hypothetical protein